MSDLPVEWASTAVGYFKCKSADKYIRVLRRQLKWSKKCICDVTPYGIIFAQVERALGEHSSEDKRFAARCIIRDIACYKSDIWGWIDDPVLLRMINGISICRYERIFIEMLKCNPLIMIGKGIMYAVLLNGTYAMMEAVLDLCEEKIVIIELDDMGSEIPNNVMPIHIAQPNDMSSDAGDLLFKRRPIIRSMIDDDPCSTASLKIKDEVLSWYGSNANQVLNTRKRNTMWDRENEGVDFSSNMRKF